MNFLVLIKCFGVVLGGCCFVANLFAQIPPGYYDDAEGLYGDELREALHQIIQGHTVITNSEIWSAFESTDMKPDGTVWDMYSDIPGGQPAYIYEFVTDQCGNYSQEGDCFNREHSFPQSWYGSAAPMSTDLFHIYPTDGFVNGVRANYPYGSVGVANFTTTNGSLRGTSNWTGYSGIVFEPIDEYKGDFARTFFYMLTRYYPQISQWQTDMLEGDDFTVWARDILLLWAADDPVSQKEIDRNNAVYAIQGNRNPFIDMPEFAVDVWDETVGVKPEAQESTFRMWYSSDFVWLDGTTENVQLEIFDSSGRILIQAYPDGGCLQVGHLPAGMYIVRGGGADLYGASTMKFVKIK